MVEQRLAKRLDIVGQRLRWLRLLAKLSLVWLLAALVGAALLIAGAQSAALPTWTVPALAGAALLTAAAIGWSALRRRVDPLATARRIEACYPDLDARLLTAVAQRRDAAASRLGYLQTMVVGEALEHGRRDGWARTAPASRAFFISVAHGLAFVLFGAALIGLIRQERFAAASQHTSAIIPPGMLAFEATIEPGDIELERGASLLALARFESASLPADVALVYQAADGEPQRTPMSKSLDDPLFAARVPDVQTDLTYRVEYADLRSPTYRVTVFEYPELQRADIKLAFPSYTGQSDALVEDALQVTAVEGTQLTLIAHLNKDVAQAELIGEDGPPIDLIAEPQAKHTYTATLPLLKTSRYKLRLVDAQGRANKQQPEFTFTALPNRRPEIKLVFPSRDVQVSPLEEIELQASVWDDFGLASYGIAYSLDGQPANELALGQQTAAKERRDARRLVSFEELKAQPDQLLSYYFFADDIGPDGKTRRTSSDMFFCEVRPFDEIFRQGEQPPGDSAPSSGGAAEQAEKLAELQKQIITATWKVIRRETGAQPTVELVPDSTVLVESQEQALEMADALEEKLKSAESLAHLEASRKQMRLAIEQLKQVVAGPVTAPLQDALAAEQAAYQALLKLRAREHQVMKGNSRSKSAGASARSADQLSQLELKNSENRYEQQRAADKQENEEQKETRQALNRLREMAQRQQDLNERIKQMQSSLEAAQTEPEKEEIRRQLKRLRDEEQQILRDADELRNRMEQPNNQQRMAEARSQLDQTREHVRQASEALEQGKTSQAAAAGARAEQQMEKLRDEFRKQTAGRFNDEMRQMRDDARRLEKNEQDIGQKLADLKKEPKNKSLRDTSGREELREGLDRQRDDLNKLVDEMRKTVEEAETAEPLLSKQLYDTIRQTHQQRPAEALDGARSLLERGFVDQSREEEQKAQAGISRLKSGIERAADSVLGDDTEALRRARDQVDQLARAIDDEMRRATGQDPKQGAEKAAGDNKSAAADPQSGKPGDRTGKPSEKSGKAGEQPDSDQGAADGAQEPKPGQQGQRGGKGKAADQKGGEPQGDEPKNSDGQNPGEGGSPNSPQSAGKGQPGSQPGAKPGEQPGAQQASQPGAQPSKGQGAGQQGEQPGGSQPGQGNPTARGGKQSRGATNSLGGMGGATGPLTGADFRPWADGLRDVEEMINDPQLRAEAAKIRDRAGAMRAEFKRHSEEPNWDLVRETISKPLAELRLRLSEDLLKRTSNDALVPLDRDPAPRNYSEQVRRYYERLGSGK